MHFYFFSAHPAMAPRASGICHFSSRATGTRSRAVSGLGIAAPGALASAWGCSSCFGATPPPASKPGRPRERVHAQL